MIDFNVGIEPWVGYLLACLAGMSISFGKTGIPGFGIFSVALMASIMDARTSVGFMLPLLIVGDVFAVAYYRSHADWPQLLRLLPATLVGNIIGFFVLDLIPANTLRHVLGGMIILLLAMDLWNNLRREKTVVPYHWMFATGIGVFAGVFTMIANAAGPLILVYLLAMGFDKKRFVGTAAWYFLILNCTKIPFFLCQNPPLITGHTLAGGLLIVPAVMAGAVLGPVALKRIPQRAFGIIVRALTLITALKLVLWR